MKLLMYASGEPDNIDQVLMVVPDNYRPSLALEYAGELLDIPYLAASADLDDIGGSDTFSEYRCYTG